MKRPRRSSSPPSTTTTTPPTTTTTTTTKQHNGRDDRIPQASLDLYGKLIDAGIHLLTIHGRTRFQKGLLIEPSDWNTIRRAVDLYGHRIPIFANGSIESFHDVQECLRITKADGVMSSEAVLEYPPLFYKDP